MPELINRDGECEANVVLYWKVGTPPVQAAVQQSSFVRASHDTIDVTSFGTQWRHYQVGRRRCLYRLALKAEPEQLLAIVAAPASIAVIWLHVNEHGPQHCEVVGVRDLHKTGSIVVNALCEDARTFL